ncbi:MAG: lipase family protein [Actinomycetota bacterium]
MSTRFAISRLLSCCMLVLATAPVVKAQAAILTPANDPFYSAPSNLGTYAPGAIINTRQVNVSLEGVPIPGTAYQLLYRSNDLNEQPIANVTTVIVPTNAPLAPRQLVSVQDAEDSLDWSCAPSYQLQVGESAPGGNENNGNLAAETALSLPQLALGRVLVIPDPEGPASGYIVRITNAQVVLDSIRAAENFQPAGLAPTTPVAMFGYSGGAFETAAANELQPTYAPELNIVGVAAGGVPVANDSSFRYIDGGIAAGVLMAVAEAIDNANPQMGLYSLLNAAGRAFYKTVQTGCASSVFASPFTRFDSWTNRPNAVATPQVQQVLAENALGHAVPKAPTFYYNALNDEIVWIEPLDTLVADYCGAGAPMDYYRDPAGAEHIQGVADFAPLAFAYLNARFAGQPVPVTCGLPTNAALPSGS